jgi:MerR family transcriptional regulator, thiopeptide resistance regulator
MLTVSKLAKCCGLSRSTLLYYESIGLMKPAPRSQGNYRSYSEKDAVRLRQICLYRDSGLKLADIRFILDRPANGASSALKGVLKRRLAEIGDEIERLRAHQRAILKLLQSSPSLWRKKVVTKEKWVSIMKASGFSEEDMHRWHAQFEKMAPAEHHEFLEFLHIPKQEIESIRDWSRKAQDA